MTQLASFEAEGIEDAEAMLDRVVDALADIAPAEPAIAKALDAAYVERWLRWRGYLVDTGHLRETFTHDSASGAVRQAEHDSIEFGTSVWYARFHSKALLRVTPTMEREITRVLLDHFAPEDDALPGTSGMTPNAASDLHAG